MGLVLTHGGKTGGGDPYAIFQDGPNVYVNKTPCWIIVVHNCKVANPDDRDDTYTGQWSVMVVKSETEIATRRTRPLVEICQSESLSGF